MVSRTIFKSQTRTQTPRLRIRPIALRDAEVFFALIPAAFPDRYSMAGQWHDKQQAHDWIATALESESSCNFAIELRPVEGVKEPTIVGSIGLHAGTEIGYMFHPDYWGKGYATEALGAFLKSVWENLAEVGIVAAWTDSENEGSMRVLRKCGFRETKREDYENATMGPRKEVRFEASRPASSE